MYKSLAKAVYFRKFRDQNAKPTLFHFTDKTYAHESLEDDGQTVRKQFQNFRESVKGDKEFKNFERASESDRVDQLYIKRLNERKESADP